MIDLLMQLLDIKSDKLAFTFSTQEFPKYHGVLLKKSEEMGGAWYTLEVSPGLTIRNPDGEPYQGWLCPATLKFFTSFPEAIYFHITTV